jgi:large repetitive protein
VLTVAVADGVLKNDDDPNDDQLTVSLASGPSNGTLDLAADGSFTYTPDADFNGSDSFTYTVSDGEFESDTATVTLTVTPVNDPPTANDDMDATALVSPVAIDVLANDTDPEGAETLDLASVTITDGPANGTATANLDGSVTYLPNFLFVGQDSFRYTVEDDEGAVSNEATVTVTVGAEVEVISATGGNDRLKGTADADLILALAGNDSVDALGGDDIVFGGRGNDRLSGGPGDDILVGGPGNDQLDGGPGLDIAIFAGDFADFRIQGGGARVQVQDTTGTEGNDTLTAIEILQFDDGFLDLADDSFTEGYANDRVEALMTRDGFSTNPTPDFAATFTGAPSTAQVETLVVESETQA